MRKKREKEEEQRRQIESQTNETKVTEMRKIYDVLKENMNKYSSQYESEIRNNKVVRAKFINICNKIGIDPIVSKRSMWGMLGDFYNQISIQILRICEKTKEYNGGLIKIDDLIQIFNRTYPSNQIDKSDVQKALNNISMLGNGCKIVDGTYISTVPFELSNDQVSLMKMAAQSGFVSENVAKNAGWTVDRFSLAIVNFFGLDLDILTPEQKKMLQEGLVWADKQTEDGIPRYYFPDF